MILLGNQEGMFISWVLSKGDVNFCFLMINFFLVMAQSSKEASEVKFSVMFSRQLQQAVHGNLLISYVCFCDRQMMKPSNWTRNWCLNCSNLMTLMLFILIRNNLYFISLNLVTGGKFLSEISYGRCSLHYILSVCWGHMVAHQSMALQFWLEKIRYVKPFCFLQNVLIVPKFCTYYCSDVV